jgi:hypothetical protein
MCSPSTGGAIGVTETGIAVRAQHMNGPWWRRAAGMNADTWCLPLGARD